MAEPAYTAPDHETRALKIPPHSIEAEQSVLGSLLFLDKDALIKVAERVQVDDFYRQDHRIIYNAINTLDDAGKPFDLVTVSEWLESHQQLDDVGGMSYLAALAENTPSAGNVGVYADIVRKRSVLRQLVAATVKISETVFNPKGLSSADVLKYAEETIFEIAERETRGKPVYSTIQYLVGVALDRVDELFKKKTPVTGVATGFDDFDERTAGLQESDLIIVAGRPSMGKTAFAVNIAEHAVIEESLSVAIFSMEMPGEQLAMRMMSSLGKVDQHKVRTGQLQHDDWPELSKAAARLQGKNLFIDDTPALTPTELRARCRRLARELGDRAEKLRSRAEKLRDGDLELTDGDLELIAGELKARALELIAMIDTRQIAPGVELTDRDRELMVRELRARAMELIAMIGTGQIAPGVELTDRDRELMASAMELRSKKLRLGLVIIDYLQLMHIPGTSENRATEMSEISRSLKAMAKELKVPVVALSQLNRDPEKRPNKRPVMSDLRESGAIEQDADVIVFIYRDEVYNKEDSAHKGIAEIIIGKQRNGPIGTVRLSFLDHLTRFENYAEEPSYMPNRYE